MAKVHLFPLVSSLFSDTRLPLQYLGGGNTPAARQVSLATLLTWMEANLPLLTSTSVNVSASTYTYTLPAGKWLIAFAVSSSSDQEFNVGFSSGTDEYIQAGNVTGGGSESFGAPIFGGAAGKTLYFSGLSGSTTLTFLRL